MPFLSYVPATEATIESKLPASLWQKFRPVQPTVQSVLNITFATYNVGTLREHGKYSLNFMPAYLREQIQAHSIDVLCLQETRANVTTQFESTTHVRLVAAAAKGRGGTEIWILKAKSPEHKPHFCSKNIVVLHADAELLIAKLTYKHHKLIVASGHAPQSGRDLQEIKDWWTRLDVLLTKFYASDYSLVLGLDANAHFSHAFEPHIGDHGIETTNNTAAECFCALLQRQQLCVPSTFATIHTGPTWTWQGNAHGNTARCDYVAVPLSWLRSALSSWNIVTVDTGAPSIDHIPALLHATLRFEATKRHSSSGSFDRRKLCEATLQEFTACFHDLPSIPWKLDVDTHAVALSENVSTRLIPQAPAEEIIHY